MQEIQMTSEQRDEKTQERVRACEDHGIQKDGKFVVLCRDKTGLFRGGSKELPSSEYKNIAGAVEVAKHMAKFGYRYQKYTPPGILLPGEMTIVRHG